MRQIAYAVLVASWSAALVMMAWLYLFTAYMAYESSFFAAILTLSAPVLAQFYWLGSTFYEYGVRHILILGFLLLVCLIGLSAMLVGIAKAPVSKWGRALLAVYVGTYWLGQIGIGVWTWSLMSAPEWWVQVGMRLATALAWPILWPGAFVLGFISAATR